MEKRPFFSIWKRKPNDMMQIRYHENTRQVSPQVNPYAMRCKENAEEEIRLSLYPYSEIQK